MQPAYKIDTSLVNPLGRLPGSVAQDVPSLALRNLRSFLQLFSAASSVGLALIFWLMARLFLNRAQRWVADRERTRHWKEEPRSLRPVRRLAKPRYYR